MRFLTLAVFSGLMVAGFSSVQQHNSSHTAQVNPVSNHTVHLVSNNRSRTTSYRGSGRRAILALPTTHLPIEG
jgi:hypothetical protein